MEPVNRVAGDFDSPQPVSFAFIHAAYSFRRLDFTAIYVDYAALLFDFPSKICFINRPKVKMRWADSAELNLAW